SAERVLASDAEPPGRYAPSSRENADVHEGVGIPGHYVTGVQSCELPNQPEHTHSHQCGPRRTEHWIHGPVSGQRPEPVLLRTVRSEERRVGKECISRRAPDYGRGHYWAWLGHESRPQQVLRKP